MQSLKTILLPVLFFAFIGCKKNRVEPVRNYSLKNTSLRTTQTSVAGRWQLHYTVGGANGDAQQRYNNTYITFLDNDFIYWDEGSIRETARIKWSHIPETGGNNVWAYCESDGSNCISSQKCIDGIWNDTLVLYENNVDPLRYYLTR